MKLNIVVIVAFALFIFSCRNGEESTTTPVVKNGNISGSVDLTDEFGMRLPFDSGMIVSAINATNLYAVFTDTLGNFLLDEIEPGKYSINYSKDGFGTYKRFNVVVPSTGAPTTLANTNILGQKSTTIISALSVNFDTTNGVFNFPFVLTPTPSSLQQRGIRLFFGESNMVSSTNYTYAPAQFWIAQTTNGEVKNFDPVVLKSNGFSSGDSAWVIAYGESMVINTYADSSSGNSIYPNINSSNSSNVVGFIIP
jgi:hypothetical protein